MSMPYKTISCQKCEAEGHPNVTWGVFYYRLSNGYNVQLNRSLGWCHACDGFRAIESLSSIEITREDALAAVRKAKELKPKLHRERLRKYLPKWLWTNDMEKMALIQAKIDETVMRHIWRKERKSPPRCLACGETKVDKVNIHQSKTSRHHRYCDGTLTVTDANFGIVPRFVPRYYDAEGRKIVKKESATL